MGQPCLVQRRKGQAPGPWLCPPCLNRRGCGQEGSRTKQLNSQQTQTRLLHASFAQPPKLHNIQAPFGASTAWGERNTSPLRYNWVNGREARRRTFVPDHPRASGNEYDHGARPLLKPLLARHVDVQHVPRLWPGRQATKSTCHAMLCHGMPCQRTVPERRLPAFGCACGAPAGKLRSHVGLGNRANSSGTCLSGPTFRI